MRFRFSLCFSDSENDERGAKLRSRLPNMVDAFAVRRAPGAGGHPNGSQQYKAHAKDILLQAARQFSGQGSRHAGRGQVEDTSEDLAAGLPPSRAREIRGDVRRVRRSPGRQAAGEGGRRRKHHGVR